MKKFLLALLVVLCGIFSLSADDVADVKAVIVKDYELAMKGDFLQVLALFAPDFQETGTSGGTINYEQYKWCILSLDGKHPEEFLLWFVSTGENEGAMLSADQIARVRQMARDSEFIKIYEANTRNVIAWLKARAALCLKTLEFASVKVDGDKAVAVVEFDEKDLKSGAVRREIETLSLRKVDGVWLFYRIVTKYK